MELELWKENENCITTDFHPTWEGLESATYAKGDSWQRGHGIKYAIKSTHWSMPIFLKRKLFCY